MNKTTGKIILSSAVFGLALTAGAMSSFAFQGDYSGQGQKGQKNPEMRQAMQDAMDNQDYAAFSELVKDKEILSTITEENFGRMIEMKELFRSGNKEEAEAIREELGLPEKKGPGNGKDRKGNFKKRMMNGGFQDTNGDGVCDNLDKEMQDQ